MSVTLTAGRTTLDPTPDLYMSAPLELSRTLSLIYNLDLQLVSQNTRVETTYSPDLLAQLTRQELGSSCSKERNTISAQRT